MVVSRYFVKTITYTNQSRSVIEGERVIAHLPHGAPKMEPHATMFVDALYQLPELGAEHALERKGFGSDDVNFEAARNERGRDLQADEAGTDYYRRPRPTQGADDVATVGERRSPSVRR